MLNKVRARHGIDLPVEKWGRNVPLIFALGALAILFIILPLTLAILRGFVDRPVITAIGIASGLVTLYGAALFIRV